jgi:predicted Zn-dependent peptidase
MKREKQVVIDEFRSYADNPMEQIFDDFECQVFRGQPLGVPVLGTKESVSAFTRTDLIRFIKDHFTPDRIVCSYSGSLPVEQVVRMADKYFLQKKNSGQPVPPRRPTEHPKQSAAAPMLRATPLPECSGHRRPSRATGVAMVTTG